MTQVLSTAEYREARRFAVQFLYQLEVTQQPFFQEHLFQSFCEQVTVPENERSYVRDVIKNVLSELQRFDELIEKNLKNWKISRLSKVDLSILRVSVSELEERKDLSVQVIIADAAEIGKEYGAEHSGGFINGVLDTIARQIRTGSLENFSAKPNK